MQCGRLASISPSTEASVGVKAARPLTKAERRDLVMKAHLPPGAMDADSTWFNMGEARCVEPARPSRGRTVFEAPLNTKPPMGP